MSRGTGGFIPRGTSALAACSTAAGGRTRGAPYPRASFKFRGAARLYRAAGTTQDLEKWFLTPALRQLRIPTHARSP
jgi:hypothetical protein